MGWWALIAAMLLGHHAYYVAQGEWGNPAGDEYKDIAMSLAQGGGFSFPGPDRWLYQDQKHRPGLPDYGATAWKEPISTGWMALWYRLLGERGGDIAITVWQSLLWAAACVLLVVLGTRLFNQVTGMVAATLLASSPFVARSALGSVQTSTTGAVLLMLLLLVLMWVLARPSLRRCALLGLLLGFSALNLAPLLLFCFVIAAALLARAWADRSIKPIGHLALVVVVSAATIAPWTARNYHQFGAFIPIQNGLGNFAYYSNPLLARTYRPELKYPAEDDRPLTFTSKGPFDAVRKLTSHPHGSDMMHRSIFSAADHPPDGWEMMDEYERDRVFLGHFKRFVAENPGEFAKLAASKFVLMFARPGRLLPVALFGLVGLVLVLRRPNGWILPVAVVAYTLPFLITAPLYYRYRYPIEPLLMLLAAAPIAWLLMRVVAGRIKAGASAHTRG